MIRIETDPPGAAVRLDGVDAGPAPVEREYTHGGGREIEAVLAGREPVRAIVPVPVPAWSWFPFDLLAEAILPLPHRHEHRILLRLPPRLAEPAEPDASEVLDRALALRRAGPDEP